MKRVASRNRKPVLLKNIPVLSIDEFRSELLSSYFSGLRPVLYFGTEFANAVKIISCMADDEYSLLQYTSTILPRDSSYESLSKDAEIFHMFERELCEEFGILPEKHPWLKNVRYPYYRDDITKKIENYPFFKMEGDEVHEVGVGPVHAGVIEPGHFRFMCNGETIYHLEIQLGYQHRGVEKLMIEGDFFRKTPLAESIAGDTSIGHSSVYASIIEGMTNTTISRRSMAIRAVALELERIAMHLGDLSALSNDIAYLTGKEIFAAMRTLVINTSLAMCGNRFGRGLITPGGVFFDINDVLKEKIISVLTEIAENTDTLSNSLFNDPGVLSRFEMTGIVDKETAKSIGLVGPAARASNISTDVRADHPHGAYSYFPVYSRKMETGDVFARAYVRYLEIQQSIDLIIEILENFPEDNNLLIQTGTIMPNTLCVSMTEGWRGEIAHCVITDESGKVIRYKIKDPSFHNWTALALSVRGNGISDFPLCNKSFNLSYCGFDL